MRKCVQITGKLLRWTHISILIHFNSIHHAGGFVKGVSGFFSEKGKFAGNAPVVALDEPGRVMVS